jgi:hypothetical protein
MLRHIRASYAVWKMGRRIKAREGEIAAMEAEIEWLRRETKKTSLAVVGSIVVLWAYLENVIDAWVEIIHHTGGAEKIQTHLPASLDRELDYIKAAWRTTPIDPTLRDEGRRLLAEIHRLKTFRHNLVHGLADLNAPDGIAFHLWTVKGADRTEIKTPYSTEKMLRNSVDVVTLKQDLEAFVTAFAQAMVDIKKGTS